MREREKAKRNLYNMSLMDEEEKRKGKDIERRKKAMKEENIYIIEEKKIYLSVFALFRNNMLRREYNSSLRI